MAFNYNSIFRVFVFRNCDFGIIAAFIVAFFVWRFLKKASSDNAIKSTGVRNPNIVYTCQACGGRFKGQLSYCPHCGKKLNY